MKPLTDIEKAKEYIHSYDGEVEDFLLPIADSLNDPVGINMAILLNALIEKGWEPDGFDQFEGYRVYKYKVME